MKYLALVVLFLACAAVARGESEEKTNSEVKPYPFSFCIVQGDELDPEAEPYSSVVDGQQYRFCCKDCWSEFRADPKPFIEKLKKLLEEAEKEKKAEAGE